MDDAEELPRKEQAALAFEDFYRREYRQVFALAYVLTGDYAESEDLTQDAFAAAQQRWERIRDPGAWVRRVTANSAVSHLRRRLREARGLARLARRQPQMILEADVAEIEFWRLVRGLPRRQAQVVALHYLEDFAVADIAAMLGCSEGNVKFHLHKARASIAKKLAFEEGGS